MKRELGDGLDVSDVEGAALNDAGVAGSEASFIESQPHHVTTYSDGGGSITYGSRGAAVSAGATSGDKATITLGRNGTNSYDVHRTEVIFRPYSPTPFTDDVEVGKTNSSVNSGGVYVDLTDADIKVHHSNSVESRALDVVPAQYERAVVVMEKNKTTGKMVVNYRVRNNPVQTEVFDTGTDGGPQVVVANSNGGGEEVKIMYARDAGVRL